MIPVLIFWIHITGGVYIFVKKYHEETLGEAFLTLGFAAIVFTAGWTLASFVIHLIYGAKGVSHFLNDDSLSLILLTIMEAVFYKIWFRKSSGSSSEDERETEGA